MFARYNWYSFWYTNKEIFSTISHYQEKHIWNIFSWQHSAKSWKYETELFVTPVPGSAWYVKFFDSANYIVHDFWKALYISEKFSLKSLHLLPFLVFMAKLFSLTLSHLETGHSSITVCLIFAIHSVFKKSFQFLQITFQYSHRLS